jgi:hypothetical protein
VAEQGLGYETDWCKLVKLKVMDEPGLTEVEFLGLFAKCDVCELTTARQVFIYHRCRPHVADDLDPTDEEK